jgi:DNA-binding beta-propeller fold protein YncE
MLSIRKTVATGLAALVLSSCGLLLGSTTALAAAGPFESLSLFGVSSPAGGLLKEPRGVAVESSTGDVFVMDSGDGRVVKYNAEGTQVLGEFTGAETPQAEFKAPGFGNGAAVVVDNSSAVTKGDVYVTSGTVVDRFKPKGSFGNEPNEYEYECQMSGVAVGCTSAENTEFGPVHSVAVDSSGNVYYGKLRSLLELEAGGGAVTELLEFGAETVEGVAVAGTDVYVAVSNSAEERELVKLELNAARNKVEHEEAIGVNGGEHAVAVDPAGDVYVLDEEGPGQSHVAVYEPNPTSSSTPSEEFATGEIDEAWGIAYSAQGNGRIYITEKANDSVHVFERKLGGRSPELEGCTTTTPTPVSAKVACTIKPNATEASWKLEYRTGAGTFTEVTGGSVTSEINVGGEITGLRANTKYEWRMTASNSGGKAHQEGPFLTPPAIDGIEPCAGGDVQGESATLGGSTLETIGGVEAKWRFEYGLSTSYGLETAERAATSFPALAEALVTGLEPNAEYHCRLLASDKYGTTEGADGTFKTKAVPPLAGGEPASLVAAHAATLRARIDPKNSETTFHFEYGQSAAYGQQTLEEAAGSGLSDEYVHQRIEDLAVRTVYHFRVVATNEQGMTVGGPDETFTTGAEGIPGVQTGTASELTGTGASISGTVDPEGIQTSYAFEVGTDTSYSGTKLFGDAGQDEGAEVITAALEDLAPGTTYHYRLAATNADGTSYGQDMTFTTLGVPSPILLPLTPPLLATPDIAFPTGSQANTGKSETKKLTNAQKLAAALRTCRTKSKGKRARCEKRVRKQYVPAKVEAKTKHKQH